MQTDRSVILYIAVSLDGYIASLNDDLNFLDLVQKDGEDYGYADFIKTIDTVIIGRKTYDWVIKQVSYFPHADLNTFVITHQKRPTLGRTEFYSGNLKELILNLKSQQGKNIFCDGGAEVVNELLKYNLVDEFILSVTPILLGSGKRLFGDGRPEQKLLLINTKQFETGLVQLHYQVTN